MNKKIVLITGVSREEGIGYGVAKKMAEQGFDVIITARSQEKAETLSKKIATGSVNVVAEALDVENAESVSNLADFIRSRYERLDVLINNAGAGFDFGVHPLETDFDSTKKIFETNLFGAWRMIQQFHPMLKASDEPRIVNISSGAGSFGDPQFGLGVHPAIVTSYGLSKLALNGLTVKLDRQFRKAGEKIKINSVCPGFVATYPGTAEMGARPVAEAVDGIIWAATLPPDGPSGGFFRDKAPLPW
ncbi:SDR family NAD(P)-dependent oxidoreductase [Tunicatimonas pelagia]|uniref:SDR family NAD(P)-dependent oxidoreductase n=1 Tax=Tunicatimonas pelagia TaxID=931531 RepID=UPI002666BBB5|nr:SDR family NAD(P)-dependent oxidoreductase [Tunicatimonas pelagia]WKN41114.1 SDR family NAD(P)-dependent oxidoreductase [Tunicatimonas pelagia]